MEAKISLNGMRFYAAVGCYATERKVGSRFELNLEYTYDATRVVRSDNVADSINYVDVYELCREVMSREIATIEHLASQIAESLFAKFPQMLSLTITLNKIAPPIGGDIASSGVSFTLRR